MRPCNVNRAYKPPHHATKLYRVIKSSLEKTLQWYKRQKIQLKNGMTKKNNTKSKREGKNKHKKKTLQNGGKKTSKTKNHSKMEGKNKTPKKKHTPKKGIKPTHPNTTPKTKTQTPHHHTTTHNTHNNTFLRRPFIFHGT